MRWLLARMTADFWARLGGVALLTAKVITLEVCQNHLGNAAHSIDMRIDQPGINKHRARVNKLGIQSVFLPK